MKRIVSLFLVLGLMAGLLALSGCTPAAPKVTEKITIEYWQYTFDTKVVAIDKLIAQFEAANPNIKVVHNTYPYENFQQKLTASIPAGVGPDVVTLFYGWLPKYITGDYLQPLPEKYFPLNTVKAEFSEVVNASIVDGKLWSLPTTVRTLALLWNKDHFTAAGLDPEKPPTTWAELVEMSKKLTKREANGQLTQAGFAYNTAGQGHNWLREVLLPQAGVQLLSNDGRTVTWNSKPEAYDTLQWFVDLAKKEKVGEIGFFDNDSNAFINGKASITVDGSFRLGTIKKNAPALNFGVAELPVKEAGDDKMTFASYWTHAITKSATGPKLEAAAKFLKFITSEASMELYMNETGELAARKSFAGRKDLAEDPKLGGFVRGLAYAGTTFMPDESIIRAAMMDAVDRMLLQGATAKDALDQAVKEAQVAYDEFYKGK